MKLTPRPSRLLRDLDLAGMRVTPCLAYGYHDLLGFELKVIQAFAPEHLNEIGEEKSSPKNLNCPFVKSTLTCTIGLFFCMKSGLSISGVVRCLGVR